MKYETDKRIADDWRYWFQVQLDSLREYGYRGAGYKKSNLKQIGTIGTLSKDPNFDIDLIPVVQGLSSSQIRRKHDQLLTEAIEVLNSNYLNKALERWSDEISRETISIRTPEETYDSLIQSQAKNAKTQDKRRLK